jgi:hypothetical protein
MRPFVSTLIALVCIAFASQAEDAQKVRAPSFSIEQLSVDGRVVSVDAEDLDGDGKLDLIAAVAKGEHPNVQRALAIFWNRGGHFEKAPDLVIPLDADVCAYDLAEVDGKPGAELLAITSSGVRAHSLAGRKLGPTLDLIAQPTLFVRAPREQLHRFRIAQPLGPKGANALIVPGLGSLTIYQRGDAGFVKRAHLDIDLDVSIDGGGRRQSASRQEGVGAFSVKTSFPAIEVADLDGDGRPDLLLAHDEEVRGYLQTADGSFPAAPSFAHSFAVRPKHKKGEGESDGDEEDGRNFDIQLRLLDVDGDGRADAVITTTKTTGISSATTSVYLFLGTAKGFADKPDQVIKTEGINFVGTQLADLTGDGRPDLLIPSFKLSLFAIVRALTSKSAKVSFLLYPYGPNRRFAETPSAERTLNFHLNLEGGSDQQAVDMYGDYLGDKRLNLAFGDEENQLSIYGSGEPGKLFTEDPVAKIAVRAYGDIETFDLDGRGKSDIVLHYSRSRGHEHELAVLHNQ